MKDRTLDGLFHPYYIQDIFRSGVPEGTSYYISAFGENYLRLDINGSFNIEDHASRFEHPISHKAIIKLHKLNPNTFKP